MDFAPYAEGGKHLRTLPGLRKLVLGFSSVSESSLRVLVRLPALKNLRRLGLRYKRSGRNGLLYLRALKNLEVPDLRDNGL